MKKLLLVVVGAACVLSLAACAGRRAERRAAASEPVSGTIEENVVTVTATVEHIDHAKRMVTLQGPEGPPVTFEVAQRVKNLPQVAKGDTVLASYYESMAYEVKKPGEAVPGVRMMTEAGTAQPGAMPAGIGARAVTVTSTIEAIDQHAPSVTLRGPKGDLVTIKVRYPEKLKRVRVGDLVEITYTQALAISVEKVTR
jgi:hypothetical protein